MPIEKLRLTNVGPFDDIEFEFEPQVNVFTGPNNSGKSTALFALGDIATYPFTFPERLLREGERAEFSVCASDGKRSFNGRLPCGWRSNWTEDEPASLELDRTYGFMLFLANVGYSRFIPALRQGTDFRSSGPAVSLIPESARGIAPHTDTTMQLIVKTTPEDRQMLIDAFNSLSKRLILTPTDASLINDEAVIQKIINLHYRSFMKRDSVFSDIVDTVADMASNITEGFPLKFAGANEDDKGFYPQFETVDGTLPFNTLSQGTQSIIQWLTHLVIGYAEYYDFPDDLADQPGVLIIDEIDAHLHPSWQRRIIPTLTERFPNLQIFCSTHSPLMLAGLKEGQVQLLRRDEDGRVTVSRNDDDIIGWSADEVMRYILDMPNTTDLQTEARLNRLQELRRKDDRSPAEESEFQDLRRAINQDLTSGPAAAQIERFAEGMRNALAKNLEVDAAIADAAESSYRGD